MLHLSKILFIVLLLTGCNNLFNVGGRSQKTSDVAGTREPAAIILNATSLSQTFQHFFNTEEDIFGDESLPSNKSKLYTAQQHKSLGEISYVAHNPTLLNGYHYRDVDQAYIRTLRVVLLKMCKKQVKKEMQVISSADEGDVFTQHVVVKRNGAPQEKDVSAIMTAMFGYQDKGSHYGAADYANLISENLRDFAATSTSSEEYRVELQNNYILLCMAIGQDPRVYLR